MQNDKFLSVSVMTQYISRKFEQDPYMQTAYVKGEVSNVNHHRSGHVYFRLKDSDAVINCALFSRNKRGLSFDLEEGQSVLVTGKIGVYKQQGSYQLIVTYVELDGLGQLFAKLEKDRKELESNGYFDLKHKKPIPEYPEKIGILTSISGAVRGDMLTTLERRYPLAQATIIDTRVQGVGSIDSVIKNLKYVDTLGFDVLILARGGGSIEDLWTFNEKEVALQVFHTNTPIITGVGHEPDTTLVDYVSDLRAATPTAAIERAVKNVVDIFERIETYKLHMNKRMRTILDRKHQLLKQTTSHKIEHPSNLYQFQKIHLDHLVEKLMRSIDSNIYDKKKTLSYVEQGLLSLSPKRDIKNYSERLASLNVSLNRQTEKNIDSKKKQHEQLLRLLNSLSPTEVLLRGYSYTEKQGEIIKRIDQVEVDDEISTTVTDGIIRSTVIGVNKK